MFFKRPFLYLTSFLILGICVGTLLPYPIVGWVLMIAGSITALFSVKRKSVFGDFLLVVLLPMILGFLLSSENAQTSTSIQGESTIIVRIDEYTPSKKNWKKTLATTLNGVEGNNKLLLYFNENVHVGDVLAIRLDPVPIQNRGNPGEFDAETYWENKGVRTMGFIDGSAFKVIQSQSSGGVAEWIDNAHEDLSNYFQSHFDEDKAGVLEALLLGDKSSLSNEVRHSFSSAGAMHVLAVSGLHVGIIMLILMFVLERLPFNIGRRNALIITLVLIWSYALFTGMSPSVLRASLMFSILLGGQVLYKQSDSINTLFFSAFILLLFNPALLSDIGFQLSYLAVLGILLLFKPISRLMFIPNKYVQKVWEGTAVGIAAQIFTFPVSLYYFHQFPNYFMISNLGVMVFAGLLLSIGIIVIATKGVTLINGGFIFILGVLLNAFLFFIQFIEQLPGSVAYGFVLPVSVVFGIYLVYILFLLKLKVVYRYAGIAVLITVIAWIQYDRYSRMTDSHMVIFNHSQPLIALKTEGEIDVFYGGEKARSQRLIDDYQKVYPGKINMHPIRDTLAYTVDMSTHSLKLTPTGELIELELDGRPIDLLIGYNALRKEDRHVVALSYLPKLDDVYHLGSGALKIDL